MPAWILFSGCHRKLLNKITPSAFSLTFNFYGQCTPHAPRLSSKSFHIGSKKRNRRRERIRREWKISRKKSNTTCKSLIHMIKCPWFFTPLRIIDGYSLVFIHPIRFPNVWPDKSSININTEVNKTFYFKIRKLKVILSGKRSLVK